LQESDSLETSDVFDKTVELLRKSPQLEPVLMRILEYEEQHCLDQYYEDLGFEWRDVRVEPAVLKKLFLMGILLNPYKSRSHTGYRLADRDSFKKALEYVEVEKAEFSAGEEPFEVPGDIFDDIVGYDDIKALFLKGIGERVHFLMVGPPASAKSLFLLCLERLPGSKYVIGSRASKAGLTDYLVNYRPRVLLVDDLDKMRSEDMAILLSLCETGRLPITLYGKTVDVTLETVVFACANTLKRIPSEALSRFQPLHFSEYTRTEFINVVEHVLKRRGVEEELALYIAKATWDILESKDPREAIRLSKLAKTKAEADEVIKVLQKRR